MKRGRILVLSVVVIALGSAGLLGARRWYSGRPGIAVGDTTSAPQGQRILVEVLNSSGVGGLARRATFLLRDRGFDVIGFGNDPNGRQSQTVILDYTNKPEAAERLARVLGGADIKRARDSLDRGIDLTVRLGSSYKLHEESFHP